MILDKTVEVNVSPHKAYWNSLGYNTTQKKKICVNVKDLKKSSNVYVMCQCDLCGGKYHQRVSRDTSVCGSCKTSLRMKGNSLGTKNQTNIDYAKKSIEKMIEEGLGKTQIARRLGVTLSVLNRILKAEKLELEPYRGLKIFSDSERDRIIKEANAEGLTTLSQISDRFNVPKNILTYWKDLGFIHFETLQDAWKRSYEKVLADMPRFRELNKTKTLKQICEDEDLSIEHLKKAFSETGTEVILHTFNKSRGEIEVRDYIRSLGFDCNSLLLQKTYEVDCYVKDKNFGVEYCGEYWHRYDPKKKNKFYHQDKFKFCLDHNISLMTIFESEWKYKRSIIKSMIASRLGKSKRIYARECQVGLVNSSEAREFHKKNHMNGYIPSSINIGLYHANRLVLCLSFAQSRFDKNSQYEITRFSSELNHTVIGGLSKAFSYFVKQFQPQSCMTYADLRFGIGASYSKIGFEHVAVTSPNYFYYNKKYETIENRMNYQKGKLRGFNNFDECKNELDIMEENGFIRLYDCGNNKFRWKSEH